MANRRRATFTRAKARGGNRQLPSLHLMEALVVAVLLFAAASLALAGASRLAAGRDHAVALHSDGTVWTWGGNGYGQLGNGGRETSPTPAPVPGLTGVVSVAAGDGFTIALKRDGTVWSWGDNRLGQLGNGAGTASLTPVQVSGLSGVAAIGAGSSHGLAVRENGTLWAWGDNTAGQLGNGAILFATTPLQVSGILNVVAVAGGARHTAAVRSDGTVWCWGVNDYGQLGDGTRTPRSMPVRSAGIDGIVDIAAGGDHTAALQADGSVWTWGVGLVPAPWSGRYPEFTVAPVRTEGLPSPAVAIAAAQSHTVAVLEDSTVWSWGTSFGPLRSYREEPLPVQVPDLSNAIAVAAGNANSGFPDSSFLLVMERGGAIRAWGDNEYGQLGVGRLTYSTAPVQVPGLSMVAGAALQAEYSLALKQDGTVWSWGVSRFGDGDNFSFTLVPEQVKGLPTISEIAAGANHSLALGSDGTVWAWGRGSDGQLGGCSGRPSYSGPVRAGSLAGATEIAGGTGLSVALKSDGTVWAWGVTFYGGGEPGHGFQGTSCPNQVDLSDVVAIAAEGFTGLALKRDGTVWRWGPSYRLGERPDPPEPVVGLTDVTAVAVGWDHFLALKGDGTLWAWGANWYGQLGDGTTSDRRAPVRVLGISGGVAKIQAGRYTSALLKMDGTVWTWGSNEKGQLGHGDTVSRSYPRQVRKFSGVSDITCGYDQMMAVKADGTLWGWGDSDAGELGMDPGWLPVTPLANMGPGELTLTAVARGPGTGSLHSIPGAIACNSALCRSSFPYGTRITLRATNNSDSVFVGWSGACSGTGDCAISMTSDKTAYATFTLAEPVRIGNTPYSSVAAGYLAAESGALVRSVEGDFAGGVTADRGVAVKLSGGYYRDFSGRSGLHTRLRGKMVVRRGTVRVDRVKIL